jgi:cyclophilin family peptidyl-prolyl cis-trans isomerase
VASASADASASPDASATPAAKTFSKAEQVIDAQNKQYTATIKTSKGDIVLKLYADKAPNTVNSFVFLAQKGYFDGITFHRVIPGFVIQAGDPKGDGTGGPGYTTADEPNELANKKYTVSMAKTSGANVFGSQFFINLKDNPSLDYNNPTPNKYYPFAEVTEGQSVVDAIGSVQTGADYKPVQPITITTVTISEQPK